MACMFCGTEKNLTDEHVFPAFMGGELIVPNGSCVRCNGDFGTAEATIKEETTLLLNLLKIKNRYGLVPNARLKANIVGLDLKNLPAFMDGDGEINLQSVVRESITEEGRRLREGFFMTPEEGETFKARGHAKGQQVIERGVPKQIVIEASYTQQTAQFQLKLEELPLKLLLLPLRISTACLSCYPNSLTCFVRPGLPTSRRTCASGFL
jgi:hypothetical protein